MEGGWATDPMEAASRHMLSSGSDRPVAVHSIQEMLETPIICILLFLTNT
jgi:hypothetical protein